MEQITVRALSELFGVPLEIVLKYYESGELPKCENESPEDKREYIDLTKITFYEVSDLLRKHMRSYSANFMEILRASFDLDPFDSTRDGKLVLLPKRKVLDAVLFYEGVKPSIVRLVLRRIQDIYGINLFRDLQEVDTSEE